MDAIAGDTVHVPLDPVLVPPMSIKAFAGAIPPPAEARLIPATG
jgi:hypothetical protein